MDFPFTVLVFPYQNYFYPKKEVSSGRQEETILFLHHENNICICDI